MCVFVCLLCIYFTPVSLYRRKRMGSSPLSCGKHGITILLIGSWHNISLYSKHNQCVTGVFISGIWYDMGMLGYHWVRSTRLEHYSPNDNLCWGLVVLLGQGADGWFIQEDGLVRMLPCPIRWPQWAVRCNHQASVPAVSQQLHLSQIRMAFHLENRETYSGQWASGAMDDYRSEDPWFDSWLACKLFQYLINWL